ncbi:MAG: hypothetical protein P4N60_08620 [Verrucomicrobiae bacterium]|nr:hypothetical protein [Verrucomicrobiae bacterium]
MPHLINNIPTILKYTSKTCALPLRFYYTKQKLDSYLIFDFSASGEPINYQHCTQDANCCLDIYNLSPFDYTIDRIKVEVQVDGGASFSCTNTSPYLIAGTSHQKIYVKSQCPMTADSARLSKDSKKAWVNIEAYIITSIHQFTLRRTMNDIKCVRVLI